MSGKFALAYFLRANILLAKWQISSSENTEVDPVIKDKERSAIYSKIISDYDTVLKLSPRNIYAYFNKGNACMEIGDYTGALSCYSGAIEAKPDMGEAYYNRGLVYMRLGNRERGLADLSKAGELGILPSYNVLKRMRP